MTAANPSLKPHLVGLFTDLLGVGGVQQAGRLTSMALADIARERGWSLELLSLNDPAGAHAVPAADEISVRGFARNKSAFVLAALKAAVKAAPGAFVIAGHPNLAPPAAWMARLRPSFHSIIMSHGIEVWQPLALHRRRALRSANFVLAPSSYTARQLIDVQEISSQRVRRVPWPLSPSFLRMARESRHLAVPPRFPSGKIVLTVGRWAANERYKGADILIRAIASLRTQVPEIQLVAIGSGDDLPRLRDIACELQVAECVHFLENLSDNEVAACYANTDVFALPSTGEGFGLVFLEAMAFGKPVVGLAAGGVPDIVRDGDNGFLVPPDSPEKLVQVIARLLTDPSLAEKLGCAGTQMVTRDYNFEAFRGRLESILDECSHPAGSA